MKIVKFLMSLVLILTALNAMADKRLPEKSDAGPYYIFDAKLSAKRSFWNFWGKDEEITHAIVVTPQDNTASIIAVTEETFRDMKEKLSFGVTMKLLVKQHEKDLYLSGNIIIRPATGKLNNDDNGKSWRSLKTDETWFRIKLGKLPQTVEIPDVRCDNQDCTLFITVSPSDGRLPASPDAKK